jgi:hypothetical protein
MNRWKRTGKQAGFVASYILYGIGLLAIVGVAYGRLNTSNEQGRINQETMQEVSSQLEILKGKILLCAAVYPDGDHLQFNSRHAYPAPSSLGNQDLITNVECPGAPNGEKLLASMPDGTPMPISPPEFDQWVYEHTEANGIRLRLNPKSVGGAEVVRTRLLRQFPSTATLDGDELVFLVLN